MGAAIMTSSFMCHFHSYFGDCGVYSMWHTVFPWLQRSSESHLKILEMQRWPEKCGLNGCVWCAAVLQMLIEAPSIVPPGGLLGNAVHKHPHHTSECDRLDSAVSSNNLALRLLAAACQGLGLRPSADPVRAWGLVHKARPREVKAALQRERGASD